ncbi:MAG: PP2C family protein-serine/threonine phosphatase [Acidobacteriaceae bacterium]
MNLPKGRFIRLRWLLLILLSTTTWSLAHAQKSVERAVQNPRHIDGLSMGAPIDLGSQWLAHQGDDPQWAQPGFDDSHWQVFDTGVPPVQQGMKNVSAIWYRTHVQVPSSARHLALMLTSLGGSAEIFVNGQRLATWGAFTPDGSNCFINMWVGAIPDAALGSGDLTIAFRFHAGTVSHHGDFPAAGMSVISKTLLGPAREIRETAALLNFRNYTSNATNLTLVLLVLLITLALAVTVRNEPEYKVLAVALAAMASVQILQFARLVFNLPTSLWVTLLGAVLNLAATLALIEFVRIALSLRRSRWFTAYYAVLLFLPFASVFSFYWFPAHRIGDPVGIVVNLVYEIVFAPASMGLPLLALWVAWRKRNFDAWLLSVPLLVNASLEYYSFTVYLLYMAHAVSVNALIASNQTPLKAFNVGWNEVVSFAFSITLLVFLVVRTIRLAREKARAASEMQAVKTLQSLLLARSQQPTPGYAVETAYRPAAEVGGDFFLVSPGQDGSLVVVVGDVSGKGLLAAMRVSLILGALNRESSRIPDEVLNRLNLVLLGQGDMGFTTACCVRVEATGEYSFANAGHLNPYIDGREVEAPGALPLGLKADQTYPIQTGHLDPGQRLVLLSDGVPEARAKKQLLGFDKLVELTRLGAGEIADAAQNFGQEDDITVLALALA